MLFRDVMVNSALKSQLISLINSGRVSHAQLFVSQPGNHAFALAVAYAQYLLCSQKTEDGESCGTCESCVKVEKLTHPDLHFYFPTCISKEVKKDPDSEQYAQLFKEYVLRKKYHIEIFDWIQELEGENKQASINVRDCSNILHYNSTQSYQGGHKIYIIWGVERLHHTAAPKLLKTLEEPEKNSLFILLTTQPDKILATIISRTQLVKIPKLTEEAIEKQLIKDYHITEEHASELAFIADGNYNTALQLLNDDGVTQSYVSYTAQLFSSCLALARQAPAAAIQYQNLESTFSEIISKGREYQKRYLLFLSSIVRYALLIKTKNAEHLLKVSATEMELLQRYHSIFTIGNSTKIMAELDKALYHIERNGNSTLIFIDFYIKLSTLINK